MGLFDRNYMRQGPQFFQSRDGMGMVWKLIIVNAIVYLLVTLNPNLADALVLTGGSIRQGEVYRLLTAGFLHYEFFHIFFNMWGLYLFGSLVAPVIGPGRFFWLYIVGALSGNLLFLAFNWSSPFALLGASGAVYAVMIAAAMVEPNRRFVMIFMPFWPLKTSTMVICFTVIELLSEAGKINGGVAHLAHLGGFVGGYLLMKCFRGIRLEWDPLRLLTPGGRRASNAASDRSFRASDYRADWSRPDLNVSVGGNGGSAGQPVTQSELDRLLDKISVGGINSLSEEELARLRLAREQMKRQGR